LLSPPSPSPFTITITMLLPKVSIVPALIVLANLTSAHPAAAPHRITFDSLLDTNDGVGTATADAPFPLLLAGLTKDGIVSMTGIPAFKETKRALMSHLHACIMSVKDEGGEDAVAMQRFPDGTIRRSFATATLPVGGGGTQPIKSLEDIVTALSGRSKSESCERFESHLSSFRSAVDRATRLFAERLSAEMSTSLPMPLLSSSASAGHDYVDIKQVVNGGEHLEHFHSYQKAGQAGKVVAGADDVSTIEFHTDQGFFIAFTPGLIVSSQPSEETPRLSDGFYIQDSHGEKVLMEFSGEDDLVFMMGDGVNQFVNNKITDHNMKLRATPHALALTAQGDATKARVWYGLMVLPPKDAHFPSMDSTFGEARQFLIESHSNGDGIPMGVGCSSSNMKAVVHTSRSLEGAENVTEVETSLCAENEVYCWHRCMKTEDYGISTETCTQRSLKVQCTNPRGQVSDGDSHGDLFPSCTDKTVISHPVTDYPLIEQQDPSVCSTEMWEEYLDPQDYDHKVELTGVNGTETMLFWSVVDDNEGKKKIKARLAYDARHGWLAIGFADPEGRHNGMNGGSIILSVPGGNYSAVAGLDLSAGGSVATYQINPMGSSFRHWTDPIENDVTETTVAEFEETDCFTAITFESDHINGKQFNFDGIDDMIWGGNFEDHFVGYHGRTDRARFTLDWNTGDIVFSGEEEEENVVDETVSPASIKSGVTGMFASLAFASMMYYLFA